MKSFLRLAFLTLITAVSATYFELDSAPSCGNSGLALDVQLTCSSSGSSQCSYGDTVTVTGTMVIPEGGISDTVMVANNACFMGIRSSATCQSYDFETSLCSLFDLEQQGCPEAGEYVLDGEFVFPENTGDVDLGSFWWSKWWMRWYSITDVLRA